MLLNDAPSMEPQQFCCLPWCGKGGPVEAHHVIFRSHTNKKNRGPVVYLCPQCHHDHHSRRRVEFRYSDGWIADGKRCVTTPW